MSDPAVYEINERATGTYNATLVGNDGVTPIPLAQLVTLTLTLYAIIADGTESIINARNAQSVLNLNNCSYHATSGLLTWSIQILDTTLVEPTLPFELHRALFEWTGLFASGNHELHLRVRNLRQVP